MAVRLTLCPTCNEPSEVTRLRVEHTTPLIGVAAKCRNAENPALTSQVELDLSGYPPRAGAQVPKSAP